MIAFKFCLHGMSKAGLGKGRSCSTNEAAIGASVNSVFNLSLS